MGIVRRIKQRKKPLFDYRRWMDYQRISEAARAIRESSSMFFIPRKHSVPQSLENIMQHYKLTEADIEQRKEAFLKILFIMLAVATLLFLYSLYLLFNQHYTGAMVGISLTLVATAMCFRYHFWYFQLKQRKLGCSFSEWLKIGVIGTEK